MEKDILNEINKAISYGGLGMIGGIVIYLNQVRKGKKFILYMFVINVIAAGWIGWLAGNFIPDTLDMKNSLVSISGFLAYPILDLIEEKGLNYLLNKISPVQGNKKQ